MAAIVIRCERCARGRVMFNGEELVCVQCGCHPPESDRRATAALERTASRPEASIP